MYGAFPLKLANKLNCSSLGLVGTVHFLIATQKGWKGGSFFFSHLTSSYLITSHFTVSHLISSHYISSHLITSYLITSHLRVSHLILSYLISSHLISSHYLWPLILQWVTGGEGLSLSQLTLGEGRGTFWTSNVVMWSSWHVETNNHAHSFLHLWAI